LQPQLLYKKRRIVFHCPNCRGRLRRVHRAFFERFVYQAVYECQQCQSRLPKPRWYMLYVGDYPRCPHCGTYRLTRLASRDRIDPMYKGAASLLQRVLGGELYHCRYCRIQFYDTRSPVAPEVKRAVPVGGAAKTA
jgi:DNA-directed RNA polymerase subunit RPC12/RpoP